MKSEALEIEASRIFAQAAEYIRKYGWQKRGMGIDGEPRCSMGALASAHPAKKWDENLARLMYDSLYEELKGLSLTRFNYKFESGEKVASLYERTARKLAS